MTTETLALEAVDIVKSFDGVHALRGARLDVRPGEIHALLGENGAGKSTLIKVLTGIYAPDAGVLRRDGEDVEFASVRAANRAGVVALYQELSIIPSVSVAENILLGEHTPSTAGLVRFHVEDALKRWEPRIELDSVEVAPDPNEPAALLISIDYTVRATDSRFNLVYPFYLERGVSA